MKIFCVSRGHLPRIRTHLLPSLLNDDLRWICHNQDQARAIYDLVHMRPSDSVVSTGVMDGDLTSQRDWIEDNYTDINEWYACIDDNVNEICKVREPEYLKELFDCDQYGDVRGMANQPLQASLMPILGELVAKCEETGTTYGGFGWLENPFFRIRKWQYRGYVKGKLFVKKNDGVPWRYDPRINMMNDHAKTYDIIARYGTTVVNRFIYVDHPQYEAGGLGSRDERMPKRIATCEMLRERFAGLVDLDEADKPVMMKRSQDTVDQWRREHGYLK